MKFPENYDKIIVEIESLVEDRHEDIPAVLSQHIACNMRLLGDAFLFISGITLAQYIRQRRLVHAVRNYLETGKSLEEISTRYGFSDAASMSKAFKRTYCVNPSQVTCEDLNQLKYQPLSSTLILSDRGISEMPEEKNICIEEPKSMFGVTHQQFASLRHILEVNAVYGLSEESLELVSYLSNDCHVRLDIAFDFVENLDLQIKNGDFYTEHNLYDIAELCCVYDADIGEALELLSTLQHNGFQRLHDIPEGFCDIYFSETNKQCGYSFTDILEILYAMRSKGYRADEFDTRMDYASWHDFDPVETIISYEEDDRSLNSSVWDALDPAADMPDLSLEPGIWELSEEEYYKQ